MTTKRASDILKNKKIHEVYYNDEPIWIQELHNDKAKIGFLKSNTIKDIYVDELYEKNLYNS